MDEIVEKAKLANNIDEAIAKLTDELLPMLNEAGREYIFINDRFNAFGDQTVLDNNRILIENVQNKGRQLIRLKDEQKKTQDELGNMCSAKWNELSTALRNDPVKSFFYNIYFEKYYNAVRLGGLIPMLQDLDKFLHH